MMNNGNELSSGLACWALAAFVGALTFVLLIVLGDYRVPAAVFLGGVVFAVLGLLLAWLFAGELPKPGEVSIPKAQPVSKPAPAAAPKPAAAAPKAAVATTASGSEAQAGADAGAKTAADAKPASEPKAAPDSAGAGTRPEALSAPREGGADDLKQIKGVGPALEKLCHELGFYHFDQIANWGADEETWVDENLQGFKGRVTRDNWVAQAKVLAAGGATEFSKRVDDGDVY